MNASDRPNPMRWLPFALVAAALAGAPAARANCCGDGGGSGSSGSYGTNSQPIAGCTIAYWLSPLGEKMGTDKCGCEEGHTPGSAITCCDPGASLRVEWTQQCTASDGGSTTVFTGHVYSNETQMGTVALEGFVIRPLEGGCSGGGCGGDNGGANQHGKAHAAEPYPNHSWSLGPDSGILRIKAAEPDI